MKALHINWTKPFFARREKGLKYYAEDFDLLTTMLSALEWRAHNGQICLVCDSPAAEYYDSLGLLKLWDSVKIGLDSVPEDVDPHVFWAAGKLFALSEESAPVVCMDTDFIVWDRIDFSKIKSGAAAIHSEPIYDDIYPSDPAAFNMRDYRFDPMWDWNAEPCNTAFTYFGDNIFLKYYTHCALDFIAHTGETDDFLTYMVFCEQRLFSMCAERLGIDVFKFSDIDSLFNHGEGMFTHTWGLKSQLCSNPRARQVFCRMCEARISRDFPEWSDTAKRILG